MAFDLAKCNWPVHRFDRSKINSRPVAFLCGRISICGSNYFRDPHDRFVVAAMIEKDFIAVLHSTKIVSGRVIAYAGPIGLAFRDKVRPRIRGWLLFYEPEIFHMPKTNPINLCGATSRLCWRVELLRRQKDFGSRSSPLQLRAFDK